MSISILLGQTITKIEKTDSKIIFTTKNHKYKMYHAQSCCETVYIEDIVGKLKDLIGNPITMAEKVSNFGNPINNAESHTWTFYKLATIKGYVTIRWYGSSNGYYSESVDFVEI